ncbi:MAG: cation:proton antiporter [Bacillota bacterium]
MNAVGQWLHLLNGAGAVCVAVLLFLSLYRAAAGPTAPDRVVAINVIGTKTLLIITLIARFYSHDYYLDIAMVYALMSFITTIGVAKYLEKGALE